MLSNTRGVMNMITNAITTH